MGAEAAWDQGHGQELEMEPEPKLVCVCVCVAGVGVSPQAVKRPVHLAFSRGRPPLGRGLVA